MPGTLKLERITTAPGSDLRQLEIQHNNAVVDTARNALASSTDCVWSWQSAAANSGQALGRGSVDTAVATGKLTAAFGGIPESKAAVTTGLAPTAQTVPADTWALYAIDMVTGGTLSVAPAALNTTGYATEALAIAALPARITAKARLGYYTVKTKAATAWIGGTDGLAGGTTLNVASATNYYPYDGLYAPTGQAFGPNGIVTAADNALPSNQSAWTGGRNGVIQATALSAGSNDYAVQTTAFLFSAAGVTNINKGAVTAGTAIGITGSIPAATWGVYVGLINSLGTITFLAGPSNFTSGYKNEAAALGDLNKIFPTATAAGGLCRFAYFTVQASAAHVWVTGTDALAGGSSGNPAAATNYYPTPSISFTAQGQSASLIASRDSRVLSSAQY